MPQKTNRGRQFHERGWPERDRFADHEKVEEKPFMPGLDSVGRFSSGRQVKAALWFSVGFGLLLLLTYWILNGADKQLIYVGLGVLVVFVTLRILNEWRDGFYLFLIWLLFEDLIRKYMGNNMAIYFAKDLLVGAVYISFLLAMRRHAVKLFKPPFIFALNLFIWIGVAQVFNPNSPSIIYGLMGLKLYYYYIPLMFLGYALIETEEDLRRFLVFNMGLAGIIALLGIIQSIVGLTFLNPEVLAPDIQLLGSLTRVAPISGVHVARPTSVFVSDGRFASYMVLMFIVGLGAAGYLLLRASKGQIIVFLAIALTAVAGVMSGSRGAFLYIGGSTLIVSAALVWGAPWRWRQGHRMIRALQRSVTLGTIGLILVFLIYPEAIGARWSLYSETLSPDSASYELGYRAWQYPYENFKAAFDDPHWVLGNGIGTASLGVQYVTRIMGVPSPKIGVESGFGTLILELGICGLFFWVFWTISVILSSWSIVRKLKQTPYFPVAIAILWFNFVLLVLDTFGGFQAFQNYINNAYLWLLLGILFRLPLLSKQYLATATPMANTSRAS